MLSKSLKKQLRKAISLAHDPSDAFTLEELEGFLYGLAITPEVIRPEEWLPVAFGATAPEFKSAKQAESFYGTMFQAYNAFTDLRLENKLSCPFRIDQLTEEGFSEMMGWVFGFDQALCLRPELWETEQGSAGLGEDDFGLVESLGVVYILANPEEHDLTPEMMADTVHHLPLAIDIIQAHAQKLEASLVPGGSPAPLGQARSEKIGRNDPCPCGSGKKYKKCCLAKDNTAADQDGPSQAELFDFPKGQQVLPKAPAALKEKEQVALDKILQKALAALKKDRFYRLNSREEKLALGNPGIPFALIDRLAGLGAEDDVDEDALHAPLVLLSPILEHLRASIERGREGAEDQLALLQKHIAERLFRPEVNLVIGTQVVGLLQENRLELLPDLKKAYEKLIEEIGEREGLEGDPADHSAFIDLLDDLDCSDPFEGLGFFLDQLQLVEPEVQLAMIGAFAQSEYPLLREIAALSILHPDPQVAAGVPEVLCRAEGELAAVTLRRLILARNWVSEASRPALDRCIKNARSAGVECASLQGRAIEEIYATPIDGAGAQGLWVTTKSDAGFHVECLIWKQSQGVIDVWGRDMPRSEVDKLIRMLRKDTGGVRVERWYLDKVACHALAVGSGLGQTPPVGLLKMAEWLEISDWKPIALDSKTEIDQLYSEAKKLSRPIFSETAMLKIFKESYSWVGEKKFADSWFEDDARVFKALKRELGNPRQWERKHTQAIELILDEILEPKRQIWQERLVLMALWLKANPGRPPLGWHKMLLMADQLLGEIPLERNPLMIAVADATFDAALQRGE